MPAGGHRDGSYGRYAAARPCRIAFEAGYIEGLNPALRKLWQRIRAGDRNPPLGLVEEALTETDARIVKAFIDVVASLHPGAVIDNTMAIVASAREDQRRLGGRHDLLCPSELFARLLFIGSPDPVAELRVRQLAQTPVPNIEALDVRDVVAIRQGSEAFATWRARLSLGLERAPSTPRRARPRCRSRGGHR